MFGARGVEVVTKVTLRHTEHNYHETEARLFSHESTLVLVAFFMRVLQWPSMLVLWVKQDVSRTLLLGVLFEKPALHVVSCVWLDLQTRLLELLDGWDRGIMWCADWLPNEGIVLWLRWI